MTDEVKFVSTVQSLFVQLPPGIETLVAAGNALNFFNERLLDITRATYGVELVDLRMQQIMRELVETLALLSATEYDQETGTLKTVTPEQTELLQIHRDRDALHTVLSKVVRLWFEVSPIGFVQARKGDPRQLIEAVREAQHLLGKINPL